MIEISDNKAQKTIFLSVFPPFRGGISDFSERTALALKPLMNVESLNFKKQYPSFLFPGSSQMGDSPSKTAQISEFNPYNPITWTRIAQNIRNSGAIRVVFSYWHPFFAPSFLHIMKNLGPNIQKAAIIHNVLPHDGFPFKRNLSSAFLNALDCGITLSDGMLEQAKELAPKSNIIKLFHPLGKKVTLSSKAKNQTFFFDHFLKEKSHVFSYLGLIRKYKGVDIFIKSALEILKTRSDVQFVIAGEFYENPQPYSELIPPELSSNFLLENRFLTENEMHAVIQKSDAIVLPYRSGTQSGILAQSMALSTPIICSDIPGLSMYVEEGKTGMIFQRENIADLTNTLTRFLTEFSLDLTHFAEIQKKWSWESFGNALKEALES